MKCKKCESFSLIKRGKRGNIQRYYCKKCRKYFQEKYIYKAYKEMIKNMLKESCGIRGISRILQISKRTAQNKILKIADMILPISFNQLGCKFEVDEMWSFIGNKKNVTWITYAIERETKQVIDFFVGRKTKENIQPLINKVLVLQPKRIYTDRLNIYPSMVPKELHKRFQYCTNKIERMNSNLRTHIKRLSRKTICFSREKKYLEAH